MSWLKNVLNNSRKQWKNKIIMNDKLKELIQPYWVEEQQGVYIPLIDKVLMTNETDLSVL